MEHFSIIAAMNDAVIAVNMLNGSWRKWSPGTVMTGYCIRNSIENGFDEFHYLRGIGSYKSRWAKSSAATLSLDIINRTVKGQIYHW